MRGVRLRARGLGGWMGEAQREWRNEANFRGGRGICAECGRVRRGWAGGTKPISGVGSIRCRAASGPPLTRTIQVGPLVYALAVLVLPAKGVAGDIRPAWRAAPRDAWQAQGEAN